MKRITGNLLCLVLLCVCMVANAKGKEPARHRETIVLGRNIPQDTTKRGRSLKVYTIAPKGEWQAGLAVAYMNFSTDNSEYLLLLNGSTARASVFRITPNAAYTYHDNCSVGLRFQYTFANCVVDATTLDLLGNFSLNVNDVHAGTNSFGVSAFHRYHIGLDNRGRVGLFIDTGIGYTRSKTTAYVGNNSDSHTINNKFSISLSPGIEYFPMNNISCHLALSLADLSYNRSAGYNGGKVTGTRGFFKLQSQVNLLSLNFGLAIHL